jgi:hypothetical protein
VLLEVFYSEQSFRFEVDPVGRSCRHCRVFRKGGLVRAQLFRRYLQRGGHDAVSHQSELWPNSAHSSRARHIVYDGGARYSSLTHVTRDDGRRLGRASEQPRRRTFR